ncbi:hypothetical protein [Arthrobacter sp. AET 35A]|uniref:hypothetical protein n=1 Tax=Arthrobacter sp. AET 35A TaxID=2292643 RepID=UPI0017845BFA|nr:hypothetical protein [Arthrobacter sp. AET 35A]MBE0011098.1 hypothetical protein [Arthrobacter sp. AET 35A]
MNFEISDEEQEQRKLLAIAVRHSGIHVKELWLYYFSIGGDAGEYEIDAYLNASYSLRPGQRDLLAHAVNEMIDELPPPPRAPYNQDIFRTQRDNDSTDHGAVNPRYRDDT